MKHLDTEDGKTADYDYFSEVKFVVPADASKYVWFDPFDPDQKEVVMPANGQKVLMDAREAGSGDSVGTGSGGSQDFHESIEPLEALLVSADLNIDSNNNEGFVYEKGSKGEDGIEEQTGLPGKVIPLNINDSDGVIDWADGFDINSSDTYDDSLVGVDFVPFLLAFPGSNLNAEDVEIVFHYDASDPAAVTYQTRSYTVSGVSDYDYQLPAEGTLRIWTKNADEIRKKESLAGTPKGDFIPKDTKIKWTDLVETGEPQVKLYLEGVQGEGLKSITVDIYYKGSLMIADADKINVTLMKAAMIPDYNRDGKIDGDDEGKVTAVNPWRWWINNDRDVVGKNRGDNGDDIPQSTGSGINNNNEIVDGVRDLLDFFPLHLDLQQSLEVLPAADFKYVLRHQHPAIQFLEQPDAVLDGSSPDYAVNAHIKNVGLANILGLSSPLKRTFGQGSELSAGMLQAAAQGKGILLMEGTWYTTAPLILEIINKEHETIAARMELSLRVINVESMYRHVNMRDLTGSDDGLATATGEPDGYPDRLTNGKHVAYVHGYNVTANQSRGSQSNIFKRLHQLGSKARYIGIAWQGNPPNPPGSQILPPDYHRAVYNGLICGMVAKVRLNFTQNSEFTVLAHSLGNSLVSNAIANHNLDVDHYYIINGAMPLEAYDKDQTRNSSGATVDMKRYMTEDDWKPYYDYGNNGSQHRFFAANWHELFAADPTDNRNKLTWKNIFAKPALLNVAYNFYSPSENVVENPDETEEFADWGNLWNSATKKGRHAWVQQEIGKGGQSPIALTAFHEINGGWQFNQHWMLPLAGGDFQPRPPAIAATITNAQLKTEPFHRKFLYPDLHDPVLGSGVAGITTKRYKVLATGIPALSFAMASNQLEELTPDQGENRNFNMPADLKNLQGVNSWPTDSAQNNPGDWLHSDFKDIALPYIHPMYQKMIDLAELDKE